MKGLYARKVDTWVGLYGLVFRVLKGIEEMANHSLLGTHDGMKGREGVTKGNDGLQWDSRRGVGYYIVVNLAHLKYSIVYIT